MFGKYSFSGKLPVTFYNDSDELPAFTDYAMENRTYRYFTGGVLYPFGYGLTYGKTEVTKAEMRDDGEHYTITATVKMRAVPCMRFCRSMCVTMNQNSRCATTAFVRLRRFHSVQMRTCDVEITVPEGRA